MSLKRICLTCLAILLVLSGSATAVTVTTARGNGADAGLENDGQSGNHGPASLHGTEASLAIRRYDGTRQKMGIVRFDLTGIEGELTGATLTFNITSTANRARTWAIYGLIDETLDNWDEATICYNNAPGMQTAALAYYTIDATKLQRLGTMDVGAAAGVYTSVATSLDLSAFLAGDTNNLVTFYAIPDTTDSTATWYIASKENETPGLAPMLTLPLAGEVLRTAVEPRPADGGQASRDVVLSWTPGDFAVTHDVYLGESRDDVSAASVANPRGTIFSLGQTANTYDPPGHLKFDTTYYWRVDEVNGAPDLTVYKGQVWSFTVEQEFEAIQDVNATASSFAPGAEPVNTVNSSGLTDDLHSTLDGAMWLSAEGAPEPAWIQFEFDRIYRLHEMWVWNYNSSWEKAIGVGFKDVLIEYSTDGKDWGVFSDSAGFAQASSAAGDAAQKVPLDGMAARYVRLTAKSNWRGMFAQYGLSEVRFYQVPAYAREPDPASGTPDLDPRTAVLTWWPGREAASHEVYLSEDAQAVADSTALAATVTDASYTPPALQLGKTYSWKVIEVNQIEVPGAWDVEPWTFSTVQYLTVDDFEGYNEDYKNLGCVYQTWIDGAGFTTPITVPGNGSGASVGHPTWDSTSPHYNGTTVETGLTIPGSEQAMPLYYDNTNNAKKYSEAVRTFSTPWDWTRYGISTLVLYFRGDVNNVPAPVYVKINGTKVLYNGGAPSTAFPIWKQWNIDLASVGVNLKSVTSLAIGVGDGSSGGTGIILVDDIVVYAAAPAPVTAADPGANGLTVFYAMEDNVQDGSGKGNHGTANGTPLYVQGFPGYGRAMDFDGTDDYVDLPIGSLVSTLNSATVAAWVYVPDGGGNWQHIFDFGTGTGAYMFLTARNASGIARFAIRSATVNEQAVEGSTLAVGWHHLAVVIDSESMTLKLYEDGMLAASGATTVLPKDIGVSTQNWLGRSQYSADPYFSGALDEFRFYNRALSESEVRYLAGDR